MADVPIPPSLLYAMGLHIDPAVERFLTATGFDREAFCAHTPAYEKMMTLAEAVSLSPDHVVAKRIQASTEEIFGESVRLCPHSLPVLWQTWAMAYTTGDWSTPVTLRGACPHCRPASPTYISRDAYTLLENPLTVTAHNLSDWSMTLEFVLREAEGYPCVILPESYAFVRPDPYHAELAVGKLFRGEALTIEEENLLMTQALRVWGLAKHRSPYALLLCGGDPVAVTSLLTYLKASQALCAMVWLSHDPTHAATVCGLYGGVGAGYVLPAGSTPAEAEALLAQFAAVVPMTCSVILEE